MTPPSAMERVPSYAPGTPVEKGLFIRLAHPPEVAAHMVAEAAAAAEARPAEGPRPLRRKLVFALLVLAALGFAADAVAGFNRPVFLSVLGPFAMAGIPIALALTLPPGAGVVRTILRNLAARFAVMFLFVVLIGFGGVMVGLALEAGPGFWMKLPVLFAFVVLVLALTGAPASGLRASATQKERLDAARRVLEAIGEDVAPGKAVTGFLDLTGPEQQSKLFARGTASSGAKVEVFRDEWLHLSAPLRDGTRLRVAAVERQKVKLARWVSRSGKTKRKPRTVAQTLPTVEVKARVDPRLYRLKPAAAPGTRIGRVTVSAMDATADTVSGVFVPSADSRPEDVLDAVAAVFAQLERVPAGAQP